MNILELESYKLSDAVKFRNELNPVLFSEDHLSADVREKLLTIANEFIDYLGINNLDVDDITLSGSNAAYTYTDHSDIDLHILIDMKKIKDDEIYRELFAAKKNLFNDNHDIKIRGYDVELYVQDKNQPVKSAGEYSILNDRWIKFPSKQRSTIDQNSVKQKVTKLVQLSELAHRSKSIDKIDSVLNTIRRYRSAGLDKHGEFGPENIAFKILRTNGVIDKLYDHRKILLSKQLSLDEELAKQNQLDRPTLTIDELAQKHGVRRKDIIDQLVKGIKVEMEHTSDKSVAREIAMDHLGEDPEYYTKLSSMNLEDVLSEASGYIPSESEKNDPRFEKALSVDVHPDTMKKNAAKFGWKIARDGRPPLLHTKTHARLKESWQQFKETGTITEQELEEVSMSPSSLKAFSASDMASGMMAGFEAELVFSGAGGDSDYDPEYEPDYDQDERASDIESVIDFFSSGDFADMSRYDQNRLRDRMSGDYMEWRDEQMMEDWSDNQYNYISDWLKNEDPDLSDEELDERVEDAISEENGDYDAALDSFRDDWDGDFDERDWLRGSGLEYMTDVGNHYDLSWPHYTDVSGGPDEGGFNESSAEKLADDLSEKLGVTTTVSGGYHSAKRDATTWIFEPDSSLEANESDDMPVEIVSPPMPLSEALEILPKFFEWAKSNGAYANKSTGFHMSVSMPEHVGNELDYTKLALFLGDEYVLKQFGREANTYTQSAISKIRDAAKKPVVKEDETRADAVLSAMRKHLNRLATNALAWSSGFGKYTSINPKNNYIEFRSAGGSDYFADLNKIQNTLMRYARATNIAMNPEAEKQEYAKKLYKLLTKTSTQQVVDPKTGSKRIVAKSGNDTDAIAIFSRYVAGELPKSQLKGVLKQLQYGREVKRQVAGGILSKDYNPNGQYVIRKKENGQPIGPILHRFNATGSSDALDQAKKWMLPRGLESTSVHLAHIENVPPEILNAPVGQSTPAGLPSQTDVENRLGLGDQTGDANWEIIDNRNQTSVFKFIANTAIEAQRKLNQWLEIAGVRTQDYGARRLPPRSSIATEPQNFPAARGAVAGEQRNYVVYDRDANRSIVGFMAPDSDTANLRFQRYLQDHPGANVDLRYADVAGVPRVSQR